MTTMIVVKNTCKLINDADDNSITMPSGMGACMADPNKLESNTFKGVLTNVERGRTTYKAMLKVSETSTMSMYMVMLVFEMKKEKNEEYGEKQCHSPIIGSFTKPGKRRSALQQTPSFQSPQISVYVYKASSFLSPNIQETDKIINKGENSARSFIRSIPRPSFPPVFTFNGAEGEARPVAAEEGVAVVGDALRRAGNGCVLRFDSPRFRDSIEFQRFPGSARSQHNSAQHTGEVSVLHSLLRLPDFGKFVADLIVFLFGTVWCREDGSERGDQWVEIISWVPRAFVYHNFLSKDECQYLINLAKPHMEKSTVVDNETGKSKDSRVRTSSGTFLARGGDKIISNIEKRIADFSFIPVENGEGLQVLHYEVGQKYEPHYDYFADEYNIKNGGQRVATLLMYLSDVEEGGETLFPAAEGNFTAVPWWNELSECGRQGLSLKPKMGDALLFWSMKPDASPDPSSLHGSCPVIKGNKWSCTKWMRIHEYKV
ncbi:hypothetical protein DM860_004771 [Cuscuta australis]|uniref:procollagen-proline 4-dioxygenase n=1 Tax=Cuscuta australis TaxID=267555 RepID=A0A328DLC6_9ASTE|nr:hypothetical protein DM860_004771 [Cuscuta australis]